MPLLANAQAAANPFGKPSPSQREAALKAERAKLNAIAQWQRLPPRLQEQIKAQLAPLNALQRQQLLAGIPSLKHLDAQAMEELLHVLASEIPLPRWPRIELGYYSISIPPFPIGTRVYLEMTMEWLADGPSFDFGSQTVYRASDGSPLERLTKCEARTVRETPGEQVGTLEQRCLWALTVTEQNQQVYAEATFTSPMGGSFVVRSNTFTIQIAP